MTPYEGGIRIALVWEMGRLRGLTKEKKESHSLKGLGRPKEPQGHARWLSCLSTLTLSQLWQNPSLLCNCPPITFMY